MATEFPVLDPDDHASLVATDRARGVRYADAPVVIEGIVGEGEGAFGDREAPSRSHLFHLDAWRYPGEPLIERKLTVIRRVGPESQMRAFGLVREDDFVQFEVFLESRELRCVLVSGRTIQGDHELVAMRTKLGEPVIYTHSRLGDLVRSRRFGTWQGRARWNGLDVRVDLEPIDEDVTVVVAVAEELFSDEAGWKERIDAFAVERLLPLKNDGWLGDDEKPFTAEAFVARMTLKAIQVSEDGSFSFWHDDGDLFWGHSIEIRGTVADGPDDADIPG